MTIASIVEQRQCNNEQYFTVANQGIVLFLMYTYIIPSISVSVTCRRDTRLQARSRILGRIYITWSKTSIIRIRVKLKQ